MLTRLTTRLLLTPNMEHALLVLHKAGPSLEVVLGHYRTRDALVRVGYIEKVGDRWRLTQRGDGVATLLARRG